MQELKKEKEKRSKEKKKIRSLYCWPNFKILWKTQSMSSQNGDCNFVENNQYQTKMICCGWWGGLYLECSWVDTTLKSLNE